MFVHDGHTSVDRVFDLSYPLVIRLWKSLFELNIYYTSDSYNKLFKFRATNRLDFQAVIVDKFIFLWFY